MPLQTILCLSVSSYQLLPLVLVLLSVLVFWSNIFALWQIDGIGTFAQEYSQKTVSALCAHHKQ